MLLEHGDVARKVGEMGQKLKDLQMVEARPTTQVTGVAAPTGLLGKIEVTAAANVDSLSCCATGVPYHFAHDCPINITAAPTCAPGGTEAATQAMVAAIVSDLKGKFAYVAQEHAKIGAPSAPVIIESSA